ncbi:MAG TPA: helix-turn-helix domain-containing protein [Vicinamibacterales bacterium]|nr:helix-turn-helix domain-containing protein [Vicinamibacterales bacterium]
MNKTFGTRLRLQREDRQIPLATIAEQTKIKLSLLEGLERDDVSRWPTGIFRRSYFRAYASAIGLEPERVIHEFQALYPDPNFEENVTEALAQSRLTHPRRPPTRLRCLIDSAVNALPALHLQPSFKSPPSGVQTEANVPVEEPIADEAPAPKLRPNIQYTKETPDKSGVDFAAVAQLCTRLARALDVCDVTPVLDEAARVLRAVGLILWVGDRYGIELTPVFTHGYSQEMTAQLGRVTSDSDNAIACAFRNAEARVVNSGDAETGAVVVPLLTPSGCAGVLALELRHGGERLECVRAAATILAAQLATLVSAPVLAEAVGA